MYRLPKLYKKCKQEHWECSLWFDGATSRDIQEPDVQFQILKQFGKICIDLPFIFMGFFVTVLIWRAFFMWKDIVSATNTREKRKFALYHFGMLFVDIIDLPFVLMAILMFITGWRAPHLWKNINREDSRNQIRLFVISQFGWWLLDIPTLVLAFIVLLSIYRAKNLVTNLREYFKNYSAKQNPASNLPAHNDDPALAAENPKPKDLEWSWHMVVFKELALLMLDLPFPILTVLTLWRMPWLIRGLIKQAESARERRVMVLSYLWKVAKDIPCAALFLLMVITVWRIPSIYDMYKKYQKGDDEHRTFLKLFIEWLIDIPFVVMGILVILWFYRFPFMIRALFKECETDESKNRRADKERRALVAQYFGICLLDILIFILGVWICGTMWRIPSLIERYRETLSEFRNERWRHTLSCLAALAVSAGLWLLDIFSLIQFAVILAGIIHIPSFFCRASFIIAKWLHERKPEVGLPHTDDKPPEISAPMPTTSQPANNANNANLATPAAPAVSSSSGFASSKFFTELFQFDPADDYADAKERFDDEEVEGKYFSLSLLRCLIRDESLDSLRHFPHLFLLPLKVAAFVFVPLHALMALRLKKYSANRKFSEAPYDTVFAGPLYWISMVSLPRMNFWGMDQFFILNLLGIVFVLPNEIALIPLAINSLYIFIITFGSPLWNSKREMLGWMGLGSAPGKIFGTFDAIMMVFQIIGVPIFIALQWFLLFLPLFIISIFKFDGQDVASAHQLFSGIFSEKIYWKHNIGSFEWYWWVLFAYWFVTMVACWEITLRHLRKFYPMFDPLIAYLWLIQRVMAGTVWRIYSSLLAVPTQWSFMNRRTCGCLGELLMFPIFIIWAYWPIVIPFVIPNYYVLIGSIPVCLFLTWRGYFIVKGSWAPPVDKSQLAVPQVQLTSVIVKTPESGGLLMNLVGTKPSNLTIENARLLFVGDAFWKTLNSAIPPKYVSAFKMAAYPVVLAPSFMDPTQVRSGSTQFHLDLKFGTEGKYKVGKKALYKNLQKMVDKEEGSFDLVIEYGTPKFGWKSLGTLVKISNIKFSQLLDSAQNGTDLITGGAAHHEDSRGHAVLTDVNRNDDSGSDTDVEAPPLKPEKKTEKVDLPSLPPIEPPPQRKPEPSTEVDMKLVQRFVEMGFDQERVLQALLRFNNSEEQTLNFLLSS
eukprot:CAMPEP_0168577694 /NCGR_PEP_ID=MMETSP0413-20121227/20924_1 /TAXON_ID=136452 /ORGANISM="Filamoeba nolandi, Strain NC-AS-23-1" /LENGTH=1164 /DNA_ID=CAMNT_0008611467 /DNA_START=761 /DNA_END=4255 /DNA_ORIENTATION=-